MFHFIPLFFLIACASPSIAFCDAKRAMIPLDGDKITVFYLEDRAQALRTNYRNKAQRKNVGARLLRAIELTTNCEIVKGSVKGDEILVTVRLKCR